MSIDELNQFSKIPTSTLKGVAKCAISQNKLDGTPITMKGLWDLVHEMSVTQSFTKDFFVPGNNLKSEPEAKS